MLMINGRIVTRRSLDFQKNISRDVENAKNLIADRRTLSNRKYVVF